MSIVNAKAYIPSFGEFKILKERFPAFASADVTEKAKSQGAYFYQINTDYKNKGYYYLRTPVTHPQNLSFIIKYVCFNGVADIGFTHYCDTGLRVCLALLYTPESATVRSCRLQTKRSLIEEKMSNVYKQSTSNYEKIVTSTAPIVIYGKNSYIWLNKTECESKKAKVMNLISVDLIERAVEFSEPTKIHNDYAQADKLREQCERVAFENATEEERAMAVEVTMSSEDRYEKLTYSHPQFKNEEESELQ